MRVKLPGVDPFLVLLIAAVVLASLVPCRGEVAVVFVKVSVARKLPNSPWTWGERLLGKSENTLPVT